jgi:hypothetical protein
MEVSKRKRPERDDGGWREEEVRGWWRVTSVKGSRMVKDSEWKRLEDMVKDSEWKRLEDGEG